MNKSNSINPEKYKKDIYDLNKSFLQNIRQKYYPNENEYDFFSILINNLITPTLLLLNDNELRNNLDSDFKKIKLTHSILLELNKNKSFVDKILNDYKKTEIYNLELFKKTYKDINKK